MRALAAALWIAIASCSTPAPAQAPSSPAAATLTASATPVAPPSATGPAAAPASTSDARAVEIGRRAKATMEALRTLTVSSEHAFVGTRQGIGSVARREVPGSLEARYTFGAFTRCTPSAFVVIGPDEWVRSDGRYVRFEQFAVGECANAQRASAPTTMPSEAPLLVAVSTEDSSDWETYARLTGTVPCGSATCFRLVGEGVARGTDLRWRSETLIDASAYRYVSRQFDLDVPGATSRDRYEYSEWDSPRRIVPAT